MLVPQDGEARPPIRGTVERECLTRSARCSMRLAEGRFDLYSRLDDNRSLDAFVAHVAEQLADLGRTSYARTRTWGELERSATTEGGMGLRELRNVLEHESADADRDRRVALLRRST